MKKIFRVYVVSFQHGWRYCILRVQRENWTGTFPKHFLFLIGYRALSETLSNFWQNFSKGLSLVQSTYPGEHVELKVFFSKYLRNLFFRKLGKRFCHISTKVFAERLSKKPCSLPDEHFQRRDFLGKTFIFVVLFGLWAGKILQGRQKMVYVDRRAIKQSGFLFRMIWFSTLFSQFAQNF